MFASFLKTAGVTTSSGKNDGWESELYQPDLDVEAIAKDLRVDAKARFQATHDSRPKSTDTEFDQPQREIVEFFVRQLDRLKESVKRAADGHAKDRAAIDLETLNRECENVLTSAGEAIARDKRDAYEALKEARIDERRAYRELRAFQQLNDLDRSAFYPLDKFSPLFWVMAVGLFEMMVNFFLFVNAESLTLTQAIAQAPLVAGTNVALAFVSGWLVIRYIHHIKPIRRYAGWVGTALTVAMLLTFNLFVSLYRLISGLENVTIWDVFMNMMSNGLWSVLPLGVGGSDLGAFGIDVALIFFVGLGAAGVALYKGYRFDDPYPGYGDCDRRYRARLDQWEAEKVALHADIAEEISRAHDDLDDRIHFAREESDRFETLLNDTEQALSDYHESANRLESSCNLLLRRYRDINVAVRDTPAPSYFERWRGLNKAVNVGDHSEDKAKKEIHRQLLRAMGDRAVQLHNSLRTLHDKELDRARDLFDAVEQEIYNAATTQPSGPEWRAEGWDRDTLNSIFDTMSPEDLDLPSGATQTPGNGANGGPKRAASDDGPSQTGWTGRTGDDADGSAAKTHSHGAAADPVS